MAVLKPEIAGSLSSEDQARVTANIQASLLRTVAALDGLAALDSNKVNAVKGSAGGRGPGRGRRRGRRLAG